MQKHNEAANNPIEQPVIKLISELIAQQNPLLQKWLPRDVVKDFFGYEDTQMTAMQKRAHLVTAKIGKRKFYKTDSILELLNSSVI
jgi:hypothetical protein